MQSIVGPRARDIAIDAAVAALIVGLFLGLLVASDRVATGSNPDQWFHFAISRMSQQGLVRTLPQAENLGWGAGFPEKEFLFHRLTALAYRIGGEHAVVLACRAVSVASLVLLYWLARRTAGRVVAAASVAGLVVANPYLLFRLGMVRPHVLAIFLLLAIAAALLRRSRLLGFAAGASFALAYHAVYLPAVLALAFGGVALYRRAAPSEPEDGAFATSVLLLVGLACGVVANPYFPANLAMGLEHLGFAFSASASLPGVHVGAEVLPMAPGKYLRLFGIALLAAIASVVWLRRDAAGGEQPWNRAVLTVAALFLVGAGLRSVRATEYGLPLLALAVAAALGDARRSARTRAIAVLALLLLPAGPLLAHLSRPPDRRNEQLVKDLFAAIAAIPPGARGAKVFACDWNYGSFLLYARPDLRFVDLLDPRFLLVNPELFETKRLLDLDESPDPAGTMRAAFDADYALCANPALGQRLERDRRVRLMFAARSGLRLYALP